MARSFWTAKTRRVYASENGASEVTDLLLTGSSVADNAAAGTTIGTLSMPAGYSPELIYDSDGKFALSGNDLVVGSTLLTPGNLRPLIRAKKSGALDLTLKPTITVTAVRLPSDISGLVAAWVCDQGVTANGSNEVTAWAGAFGTSINLSGAAGVSAPTVQTGIGPKGLSPIGFASASSQFLSFSTPLVIDDCTIVLCWKPRDIQATVRYVLGNSSSGFALGHHSNVFDINFGTTGSVIPATNYNLVTTRYQCHIITHDGTNGTGPTIPYTDGGAGGSSVNCGTTAKTIDRLGRQVTGAFSNMDVTAVLIYSKVLSTDEIAAVEAWAQAYRTMEWYFSNAGSDSNTGLNTANAKQNPASVINAGSTSPPQFRPWDRILLNGGDYFYDQSITATSVFTATSARPVKIQSYGAGKPHIWGQAQSALTWTNSVGDIWTAPLTRTNTPTVLWWYRDGLGSPPVHMYSRTVNQDASFSFASSTLTLQLASGKNPNNEIIVIPKDSTSQSLWAATKADISFRDLEIRHYSGQAWAPQGARNHIRECDIGYTADDGLSPGAGGSGALQFNTIRDCGGNKSTSSGPGDGISIHGGTGWKVQYDDIADCGVAGIRNEMGTGADIEGNVLSNNNQGIRALYNVSYDNVVTWNIRANQITRSAADAEDAAIKIDSQVTANQTFSVTDNVMTGLGTARGKAIDNASPSAVFSQSGNSQTGFSSLT